MTSYKAEGGIEVTDEMIDKWDEDANNGIFHGEPGPLEIKKPLGRPTIYEEAMVPVTFRIPEHDVIALKTVAKERGMQFSDLLREACHRELDYQR